MFIERIVLLEKSRELKCYNNLSLFILQRLECIFSIFKKLRLLVLVMETDLRYLVMVRYW